MSLLTCKTVVVTPHLALVTYLRAQGVLPDQFDVVASRAVEPDHVRGKRVFGVLPYRLAALAESVTEVTLEIPYERRGFELTLEEVGRYFRSMVTYQVTKLD